jgi:hypothetical protein
MSNPTRHWLGLLTGLVAAPIIYVCFAYAAEHGFWAYQHGGTNDRLAQSGLVVCAALIVAALCSSRLSPLASLVSGAFFLALSLPFTFTAGFRGYDTLINDLPRDLRLPMIQFAGPGGVLLTLGAVLVAASAFPARWRSAPQPGGKHSTGYTPAPATPPALQFDQKPKPGFERRPVPDERNPTIPLDPQQAEWWRQDADEHWHPAPGPERPGWAAPPPFGDR